MAASAQSADDTKALIECSLCLSTFQQPKCLPCIHTFCLDCLQKYVDQNDFSDKLPCPLCRHVFTIPPQGLSSLPNNFFILNMIELESKSGIDAKQLNVEVKCDFCLDENDSENCPVASKYCRECNQNMCKTCVAYHVKMNITKSHTVVSLNERAESSVISVRNRPRLCEKHGQELLPLYCLKCDVCVCISCMSNEHNAHTCENIADAFTRYLGQFDVNISKLEGVLTVGEKSIQKLKDSESEIVRESSVEEQKIRERCVELRKMLDSYEEELLCEVRKFREERVKEVKSQLDQVEFLQLQLESFVRYLRGLKKNGSNYDVTCSGKELVTRAEHLLEDGREVFIHELAMTHMKFLSKDECNGIELERKFIGELIITGDNITALRLTSGSTCEILENHENHNLVRGVTVVGEEIFVVRDKQSQVSVYDSHSLRVSRDINIPYMTSPEGLAGCAYNRALYISDRKLKCIHRVDLTNNSVTRWEMRKNHIPRGLSVTAEHTLLVTVWISDTRGESIVVEYTSEGQQVRELRFDRSIEWAWHTVQLSSDQFIVSHGEYFTSLLRVSSLHRVCVINAEGQIIKSFGRERGGGEDQLWQPQLLAIDEKSKHVFLADQWNSRVLMLDSELMTRLGEVHVSRDLTRPSRLYFDSSTDRLFVAEVRYSRHDFSPRMFVVTHPELRNSSINK